jgi:hypothetical protein
MCNKFVRPLFWGGPLFPERQTPYGRVAVRVLCVEQLIFKVINSGWQFHNTDSSLKTSAPALQQQLLIFCAPQMSIGYKLVDLCIYANNQQVPAQSKHHFRWLRYRACVCLLIFSNRVRFQSIYSVYTTRSFLNHVYGSCKVNRQRQGNSENICPQNFWRHS